MEMEGFPFVPQDVMSKIGWVTKSTEEGGDASSSENEHNSIISRSTNNGSRGEMNKGNVKIKKEHTKERKLDDGGAHEKEMIIPGVCIESLENEEMNHQSKFYTKLTIENTTCTDVKIAIYGRADMKVIKGEIEVMGYRCTCNSLGESFLRIDSPLKCEEGWYCATLFIQSKQIEGIRSDVEVHFYSVTQSCTVSATRSFQIVPTSVPKALLKFPPSWLAAGKVISDAHRKLISATLSSEPENIGSRNALRILVCGTKGVGKSTCLRYIVNRLLSINDDFVTNHNVCVLDCDVGQPECSPPGMLTLTRLSKPMISPPAVNMVCGKNDESCAGSHTNAYFFGDVSSKSSPSQFIAAISNLMQSYHAIEPSSSSESFYSPLVVNTDGWVKGMGFELLSAVIDAVNPHYIIQIRGATKPKSFDLSDMVAQGRDILYLEAAGEVKGLCSIQSEQNNNNVSSMVPSSSIPSQVSYCAPSPVVSRVSSFNDVNGISANGLSLEYNNDADLLGKSIAAADLRTLRLCTYFLGGSQNFRRYCKIKLLQSGISDRDRSIARHLASMKPYVVPFNAVDCHILEENFDMDMVLAAMNGSIVGLCYNPSSKSILLNDESISHYPCVGLGIVRSIDEKKKLFYILSPVPIEQLTKVTILVKGRMHLPLECIYQGKYSQYFPYQSCDGMSGGVGSARMKSRSNPTRKFK